MSLQYASVITTSSSKPAFRIVAPGFSGVFVAPSFEARKCWVTAVRRNVPRTLCAVCVCVGVCVSCLCGVMLCVRCALMCVVGLCVCGVCMCVMCVWLSTHLCVGVNPYASFAPPRLGVAARPLIDGREYFGDLYAAIFAAKTYAHSALLTLCVCECVCLWYCVCTYVCVVCVC